MNNKYSIGLDIGTGSIGWAGIDDDNYRLIKCKGKYLTGVRLFPEADTANGEDGKGRRNSRSNRRRKDRQKWRLREVDRLFKDSYPNFDPLIWTNKGYSWVSRDDKRSEFTSYKKKLGRNPLQKFYKIPDGEDFKWLKAFEWKDSKHPRPKYYEDGAKYFPSIYHLRQALIDTNHPERYTSEQIYLAVYHIIKNRGHFNFTVHAGANTSSEFSESQTQLITLVKDLFQNISNLKLVPIINDEDEEASELNYVTTAPSDEQIQEFVKILIATEDESGDRYTNSQKKKDLVSVYNVGLDPLIQKFDKKFVEQIFSGLLSMTFNVSTAFKDIAEYSGLFEEEKKFDMGNVTARENYDAFVATSGELKDFLTYITTINDLLLLQESTGGKPISKFLIGKYEAHAEQLVLFKQLLNEFQKSTTTASLSEPLRWLYDQWIKYPNSVIMRQKNNSKTDNSKTFGFVTTGGVDTTKFTPDVWLDFILNEPQMKNGNPLKDWQNATDNFVHVDSQSLVITSQGKNILNKLREAFQQDGVFPKQRDGQINRSFPNSMQVDELIAILDNVKSVYPELMSIDEFSQSSGTAQAKLVSLAKFRVPYWIGPLVTTNQMQVWNWAVRRTGEEDIQITPYNYKAVIDLTKTQQVFIERLKVVDSRLWNDPSYEAYVNDLNYQLDPTQDPRTLPKNSLVYQEFQLIEELNNFLYQDTDSSGKVVKNHLDADTKMLIFETIFKKETGKIKYERIFDYLRTEGIAKQPDFVNRKLKNAFNTGLKTYHQYLAAGVPGSALDNPNNRAIFERIANLQTIMQDTQSIINGIKEISAPFLNDNIIKKLSARASGYSNQSWKMLEGIRSVDSNGEPGDYLLDILKKETRVTFDSVYRQYGFEQRVERINEGATDHWRDKIDKLKVSPMFKRPMIQSVRIVQDIEKFMGYPPENVYVEVATDDEQSKHRNRRKISKSRFNQLEEWAAELLQSDTTDVSLKPSVRLAAKEMLSANVRNGKFDKIFLYFLQEGKDIYTGKPFVGDALSDILTGKDSLEIDHISPYSRSLDDSLSNRVLTTARNNAQKGDLNRVPGEFQNQTTRNFWKSLWQEGSGKLMTNKKYQLLTSTDFGEDKERFVGRQLTGVRQITKNVVDILNSISDDNNEQRYHTLGVKPGWSQQLRKLILEDGLKANHSKVRDLNDIHHAHDAYFIAQIGRVNHVLFSELEEPNPPLRKIYDRIKSFNVKQNQEEKNSDKVSYGFLVGYVAENGFPLKQDGSNNITFEEAIKNSKRDLNIKQYIISQFTMFKSLNGSQFWDQGSRRKGVDAPVINQLLNDSQLYGGIGKPQTFGIEVKTNDNETVILSKLLGSEITTVPRNKRLPINQLIAYVPVMPKYKALKAAKPGKMLTDKQIEINQKIKQSNQELQKKYNQEVQTRTGSRYLLSSNEYWSTAFEFIPDISSLNDFYNLMNDQDGVNVDQVVTEISRVEPAMNFTVEKNTLKDLKEYVSKLSWGSTSSIDGKSRQASGGRKLNNQTRIIEQSPSGLFEKLIPITEFIKE